MIETLHIQINRFAFWCSVLMLVSGLISLALPLDAPRGVSHVERSQWLLANREIFILAWTNQIVAMVTLTGALLGYAWLIRERNPLLAILGYLTLFASFISFIVPKFMAIWTIPMLTEVAAAETSQSSMADSLLMLLNVSVPYSLFTAFDYLGFWLYAVFALLIAVPVYDAQLLRKFASVSLALFAVSYHLVLLAILLGTIDIASVETYALSVTFLLLLAALAGLGLFRTSAQQQEVVGNAPVGEASL